VQRDWYYRHAHFERRSEQDFVMTFGGNNQGFVLELLRWLGPGAELIEPKEWREAIREELRQMLTTHLNDDLE
jgi:predicted DNA-binding transcriptional regulator YafY